MRKIWLAIMMSAAMTMVSACHPPATLVLTPDGQAAYTGDQEVVQLGHFQQLVVDLYHAGKVKQQDALDLSVWLSGDDKANPPVVGLMNTIAANPTGWQVQAKVTWMAFRPRLSGISELAAWLPIIDGFFTGVQ